MDDGHAPLRAVCAHPEDDLPRLVYADWLDEHDEPDRARFIRLQVGLAHSTEPMNDAPLTEARRAELEAEADALLKENRKWWDGPLERLGPHRICYERGFPNLLYIDAGRFLSSTDKLFDTVPITSIRFTGDLAAWIDDVAADRHLQCL